MPWTFPTLDAVEGRGAATCPCGRRTTTDMIADLRALPASQREALGLRELACDGCCARAFGRGLDRVAFFAALGAPQEVQDRVRAFIARKARGGA